MNNKGITLVSLVITIIVMLILAGVSLSMVLGDGSVLDQAKNASTATVLAAIKEEFELNKTGRKMQELVDTNGKGINQEDSGIYALGEEVKTYIPNIDEGYIGKIGIFNDELIFIGEDLTDEEKASAAGQGITTMNNDDYAYITLMKKMEKALLSKKGEATKPGTALSNDAPIEIAGINYGASWYRIDVGNLDELGFSAEEIAILDNYDPFVGRFDTGEVLSDPGRTMYADNPDKKIHKYTFNYFGDKDGIVVADLMAGVDASSTKTSDKYGAFSVANGSFTYDTADNNALIFNGGAIGELPIDESVTINKEYSINLTIKCDVDQTGEFATQSVFPAGVVGKHHRSMIAISDKENEYVCWIGVDGGVLRVYNYRKILTGQTWASNPKGFLWVDVREYDNKYMNIQFTAKRGEKAKLYINGELKAEGDAGLETYTYNTLTIGDLRKNRNLKFLGKMYNVSIYARELTPTEVKQNYETIKKSINGWN